MQPSEDEIYSLVRMSCIIQPLNEVQPSENEIYHNENEMQPGEDEMQPSVDVCFKKR